VHVGQRGADEVDHRGVVGEDPDPEKPVATPMTVAVT
jgi:hypothetical protein